MQLCPTTSENRIMVEINRFSVVSRFRPAYYIKMFNSNCGDGYFYTLTVLTKGVIKGVSECYMI